METTFNIVEGDLIDKALNGEFDVIAHGCNCFCMQKAGIAATMAAVFLTDNFEFESQRFLGDYLKLGNIEYQVKFVDGKPLHVYNLYTQFRGGANLDIEALTLCLRKLNMDNTGMHIGLPLIGGGIAGGDKDQIIEIMKRELIECNVTLVLYKPKTETNVT
jgi:O-acetyl-ADP-ribose deacetylase (regulator of RNase III)